MNSQYLQIEKLHLQTLPKEYAREARQIQMARQASSGNHSLLSGFGARMMQLKSQLVQRFSKPEKAEGAANCRKMQPV